MATIYWQDGQHSSDLASIQQALAPLGVMLNDWPIVDQPLLSKPVLSDSEKDAVLTAKLDFIKSHGLVVWRFHDHIHQMKPDMIMDTTTTTTTITGTGTAGTSIRSRRVR